MILFLYSSLKHSGTLLTLLMNVGYKYADSGRAKFFIPDLLTVDAPELFHHARSATISKRLDHEFRKGLADYIKKHSLRKFILRDVSHVMVSQVKFVVI